MKKAILSSTAIFLAVILLAGCTREPQALPSPKLTPPPSTGTPTPPLPTTKSIVPDNISPALQSGLPLRVIEPSDAAIINAETVTVKGQTSPGAIVNINDEIGVADASGNFSVSISLKEGPNVIDVVSADEKGKEGEVLLLVTSVYPQVQSGGSTPPASENFQGTLPIRIIQPLDASTISSDTVTVRGQTAPGATIVVNDETGEADASGNFSITINLESGLNVIDVIVFDDNGNDGEVFLMVNVVV